MSGFSEMISDIIMSVEDLWMDSPVSFIFSCIVIIGIVIFLIKKKIFSVVMIILGSIGMILGLISLYNHDSDDLPVILTVLIGGFVLAVIGIIDRIVKSRRRTYTHPTSPITSSSPSSTGSTGTTVLGKWVAIGAPHEIEFFIGDECEMFSPADGEIISGTYSVSGNKIIALIDGDTNITFEILPNNTIQMLPPAGRALPPLPFMRTQ